MITFYFNDQSKEPMYVQLYQHIKELITNNQLKANQKLPSKRKLAIHLKVSQITIDTAYQQLIAEGYVRSKEKSGFYVEEDIPLQTITMDTKTKQLPEQKVLSDDYRIRFQTNIVDATLFPNRIWVKLAKEILEEYHHEMLNTTNPQGFYELRVEICSYLLQYRGIKASPDQVVLGAGSENLIHLILQLCNNTTHYAVEDPGYGKLRRFLSGHGKEVSYIPLDEFGIDVKSLSQTSASIVIVTPSHQFPLGIVMPMRRRSSLLQWANKQKNHFIVEDDYDSEFRFIGQPIPALKGLDYQEKVIYMNTFTKSLAPSFKMSYIVLPNSLLERYHDIQSYNPCTVPNFEQYMVYKFMKEGHFERHINRMRNAYKQKIECILAEIEQSPRKDNIHIKGAGAGLHFILEVTLPFTEEELTEKARKNGIWIAPLSDFLDKTSKQYHTPTFIVGYSGIPLNKCKESIQALLSAWT